MVLYTELPVYRDTYQLILSILTWFNKGKLNKGLQFGRAYQLGRVDGNFLVVGECTSVYMPDAPSLPAMICLHQNLFGKGVLQSIATDKGGFVTKSFRDSDDLSTKSVDKSVFKMYRDQGLLTFHLPKPGKN